METLVNGWRVAIGTDCVLLWRPGNHGGVRDAVLYPPDGTPFSGSTGVAAAETYIRGQTED